MEPDALPRTEAVLQAGEARGGNIYTMYLPVLHVVDVEVCSAPGNLQRLILYDFIHGVVVLHSNVWFTPDCGSLRLNNTPRTSRQTK